MRSIVVSSLLLFVATNSAFADNWPNWRGPNGNGTVQGEYPTTWSDDENVAWKVPMISSAGSTPIVWGDQIFLTAAQNGKNVVQCLNLSGQELWRVALSAEVEGKHKKGSGCNPSPVTDGEHVYVYYKSGDLACLSLDGKIVWRHNLQGDFAEDTLWWDLGTSPILSRDYVIVACVQSGPSYLAAWNRKTGELAWKVDRMLGAPEEANQTYSTPFVVEHNGKELLIVLGADHVTAHAVADGAELWRVGGMNPEGDKYFRSISSPVIVDRVVIAPYARGTTLTAIDLEGKVIWNETAISADVPTPAALGDHVFVCADKGRFACLEAKTGQIVWEANTGKHRNAFSASPIVAGRRLYLAREDGTVFVYEIDGEHRLLAENSLSEFTVATPVFVRGRILLRTADHLFCIGTRSASRRTTIVR